MHLAGVHGNTPFQVKPGNRTNIPTSNVGSILADLVIEAIGRLGFRMDWGAAKICEPSKPENISFANGQVSILDAQLRVRI